MKTPRGIRRLAAAALLLGLAAAPANAGDWQTPASAFQAITQAARLWLGNLLPIGGRSTVLKDEADAGIFKLKQHVDNPGQTPMKDGP